MKKIILFLVIFPFFVACDKKDDEVIIEQETEDPTISILGTWIRVAGRNSNDFPPYTSPFVFYDSENTVTFYPDSTLISNSRSLCSNTHLMTNPITGIYTLIDSTYTSNDCVDPNYRYHFTQTDSILIISYPYNGISEGMFKKIADI